MPDKIIKSISDITPELLVKEQVEGLVLDIDNTLAPRNIPLPDEMLKNWIAGLKEAKIKLFIISNNRQNRVAAFADALGLPFRCNSMKPFPQSFRYAVREMGIDREKVAAVGDQIYTDVMGAHASGIRAWLVMPIDPSENPLTKIRRRFEKPVLKKYYKTNSNNNID